MALVFHAGNALVFGEPVADAAPAITSVSSPVAPSRTCSGVPAPMVSPRAIMSAPCDRRVSAIDRTRSKGTSPS